MKLTIGPVTPEIGRHDGLDRLHIVDPEILQQFEDAAMTRAQEILEFIDTDGQAKQSSAFDDDELENAVMARAGELLGEAGYDVDAIAQAIYGDQ